MTPEQILEQEKQRQAKAPTPADILAGEKSRMAGSANGSFYVTRDVQPDRASKVISLADRMGAQPDFVDKNLETIEQGEEDAKRQGLLSELPRLANYFADPYRAAEAKDSVVNFAEIEKAYIERRKAQKPQGWLENPLGQVVDFQRSLGSGALSLGAMGIRGIGEAARAINWVDVLAGTVGVEYTGGETDDRDLLTRVTDSALGLEREAPRAPITDGQFGVGIPGAQYVIDAGNLLNEGVEYVRPENQGFEDRVAEAIGQIAGAVGLTAVTRSSVPAQIAFFGMGADQQAQAMRRVGIDPRERPGDVAAGALVTGGSEALRLGSILRVLPKQTRDRAIRNVFARIAGQAGEEAAQETIEGIGQNLITMGYDAEATVLDGLGEQALTAGTAAAVFQALVETALPGKQRGVRAEQAAQELTDIRALIEETPVFQRSRQAVEAFLNEAGDGETVLLHGEDLIELFQSDPQVFAQRMEEIGLSEEDVQRAAQGMDVEVEAAKILSVTEGFEDLVKRVRIDDDTPSLREMEREVEESDALGAVDFQAAFEQFQEQDLALEGFERVQSAVTEQLLGAGRSQAESQAAGAVWGAMFRQLNEAGVDEAAVFERLGLQINPEQAPRMPKPQEPQTLHSFVRSLGGIREAFGEDGSGFMRGEVDSRLGERVPGLINNQSGRTLDEIFRAATEEGGYDIRDEQELLDLIEQDLSGERVYPLGEGEVYAAEMGAYESQFDLPDGEVMDQAAQAGYEGQDTGEAREWLEARAAGLDMSQAARMARAREMGFDTETVLYHGTDQDFMEFRPSERGKAGPGIYLTPRPEKAERYAMDRAVLAGTGLAGQVKPVFIAGELASFEDRQSASQAALEKIRPKQDSMPSGDFNRLWSITRNEILADQGYSGIQISDEVVIFDPSNIRSVNAAFDPDASDSANLLAQSAPTSMREALRMQPQDRAEWFEEEVTQRIDADGTTVLTAKSRPDRETDDIAMRIDDGGGVTMRFEGRLERRDNKVLDPETGKMVKRPATREEVQQSVLTFSRSIAMLEEYVSREKPESIHFTGSDSTDTRNKMYLSLLKRMRLPGYRAFEVKMNRISTAEVEGDKRVRSSLHNRAFYVIREDAVERKRAQFRDGELRTSENAPPEGVEGPTYRDNFLDTADEVGRLEPGRVGQSDGRGTGDGVRGATFTEIEPAQRELFQSAYHGTPHEFTNFDTSKLGTGEGAQAYGPGLYFASRKGIAEWYQKVLAAQQLNFTFDGEAYNKLDGKHLALRRYWARRSPGRYTKLLGYHWPERDMSKQWAGEGLIDKYEHLYTQDDWHVPYGVIRSDWDDMSEVDRSAHIKRQDEGLAFLRELQKNDFKDAPRPRKKKFKGNLMKVELNVESHELIDYDKPVAKQPPIVRAALMEMIERGEFGAEIQDRGAKAPAKLIAPALGSVHGEKVEFLKSRGVKGVQYLDASSRKRPKLRKSRNFVVFDGNDVVTVEINGKEVSTSQMMSQSDESGQELLQRQRASVLIPDSNGLVAIRTDDLGFITSAEKALFDPPPRFRDARNLTADQWRKYFREAGATKEAFDFMIEPALAGLPQKGDIRKADVIKAVRAQRPEVLSNQRIGKIGRDTADDLDERGLPPETDYRNYVSPGDYSNYRQELIVLPDAAAGFKSHNWNTEGVVGHIRTTDRKTTSGESVRFVDELQSDLHQERAQFGKDVDDVRGQFERLREKSAAADERLAMYLSKRADDLGLSIKEANEFLADDAHFRELDREAEHARFEKNQFEEKGLLDAPPRAPVQDWEKPFIRRVIQQAIADDKKMVAFTNHKTLNTALQNEGTQKFYDDRLPAHIRKVAKELGATVERVDIGTKLNVRYESKPKPAYEFIGKKRRRTKHYDLWEHGRDWEDSKQYIGEFTSKAEVEAEIAKRNRQDDNASKVLAIRITPEAKAKLAKGNVLFQEKRASVLIPGGGVLTDQNVIVNLLKKKDRTSFMHESAHIFLELYAALESENEVIAERMAAVRKWLKIKPGEKITRDQHEKFAESFEAYLMEGVAPSAELRGVFHSFRQWFIDVYRRLRGQLRNLEPEAKDIFDRMLASDIEIEMAQGQYVGTLNKAMEGIMSPEQVEKYQKHARKAGNVARDKLFKKHMEQVKRRERKAYKEEAGRVEDMVRAQMAEWPEYKALIAFTTGGRTLDASLTPEGSKLNTSENGEHPEIVAPQMGFTSADAMFKAVAKMPNPEKLVRDTVKKIMTDRHGDMMEDGSIEAEAMEAVFNESSIRMMEAERNALAAKASAQPIPLIAIRKRADQIINETPIDKVIKPGRYAIKARDLHKRALRSAARGKWDEALRITHQAMLMHELARRAFKARDEIEKANRYLAKFAPHRKLDPKKIAPEYIAQIRALMSLPGGQDQTEARDGLIKFADAQANDGYAVVLPSDVVAGRDLPIRRRMTMEQLREFRDGVKNLNTLGRQQSAEAVEQFNAEAQAIADEIDSNWKGKRKRETRNPTRGERLASAARTIDAEIIRWPFLVEALQGGKVGKIVEIFDTKLRQALTNRNARRQKMADELAGIFRKHKITQGELNKRVSAPVIETGNVKFEQIIAVAMNMGTEQNRDRLVADPSMNGDMAAIEAMLAEHLEQRHWDAVQEIWDLIGTMWPEASAVERKATGVTPKKVEASSVNTPYGQYRGGYYPLKYDKSFLSNTDLKQQDNIDEWKNGVNGMATRASTQQGFLKERQQNVERPIRLSLDVILSHIDDVTNDIYMREPASYVSRLLQKRRVQKAIRETQGPEYLRTMETILKRTVTGTERAETLFEKVLQTLRINASVAILGGNVVTAGLAPISYFQTVIPQYGFKTVFGGIAEYYSNPIRNAKLIVEKSAFMRERQDTLTREAHELIRKSAGQSWFAKGQGLGYWMMAIAEKHSVSGPLWVGVYNQAKAEGASEADAITRADRAVSTTQGSGLELDQSVLQGGNEGVRLLTFMWGYVSGYYGTVRNDVVSAEGLKKLVPLIKHMVILNLVASMLEALLRGGFGDEEDPYVVAVWQMMMRNTFGLIPGVSSAFSKYDSGPAAFQVGTSMTRATENWRKAAGEVYEEGEAEGETVRRAMLESAKAGGFLFGIPGTVQAMKIEKTYAEDDDPTLYEAIVTGPDDDN